MYELPSRLFSVELFISFSKRAVLTVCFIVVIWFVFVLFLVLLANMSRTALTLSDKVKLIELKETQKLSTKELITRFKCGKTQVYDAIKNKEKIMDE